MKFTYNWLKDFVDVRLRPAALAEKLTMAGLEVKSLEARGGDQVFEIEITSNRPDWLSVIGIAREVAALTEKTVRLPAQLRVPPPAAPRSPPLSVVVASPPDCPLYTARLMQGIRVGASPAWLKRCLELVGCRSINNIVDVTNYILFTYGEPLHAFDADTLAGTLITVRRARRGEKLITIDGQERLLDEAIPVIADSTKPVALAGIMGGRESEVTGRTVNIILEAAVFDPALIRRAKRIMEISTESAYRFERGVDVETALYASEAASRMIRELAGGSVSGYARIGKAAAPKRRVAVSASSVENVLGVKVPAGRIKTILSSLGFMVRRAGDSLRVDVPSWRQDIRGAHDLIEEIARVYGYERIPAVVPPVVPAPGCPTARDEIAFIKQILTGLGFTEALTYSLTDAKSLAASAPAPEEGVIELMNPLSSEHAFLRPSIVAGLIACAARNFNQKEEFVAFFEIAKVYSRPSNPREEWGLSMAVGGVRPVMLADHVAKDKLGLLHLKGSLQVLFARLRIKDCRFCPTNDPLVTAVKIAGDSIGRLRRILPGACDIKNKELAVAEINLQKVFAGARYSKTFAPLPRHPAVVRDISFVLSCNYSMSAVRDALRAAGKPLLENIEVTDYYRGAQIPAGHRGITVSCSYRAPDRTLTESEVDPIHARVCGILTSNFAAVLR